MEGGPESRPRSQLRHDKELEMHIDQLIEGPVEGSQSLRILEEETERESSEAEIEKASNPK